MAQFDNPVLELIAHHRTSRERGTEVDVLTIDRSGLTASTFVMPESERPGLRDEAQDWINQEHSYAAVEWLRAEFVAFHREHAQYDAYFCGKDVRLERREGHWRSKGGDIRDGDWILIWSNNRGGETMYNVRRGCCCSV